MKAVNHKDGDVYNNDPSNIEIVDVGENRSALDRSISQKIDQIARLVKEVREYKAAHPETVTGYYLNSYGSLLNAYREGDLSFEDCVTLLAKVDQSKRTRDDAICDDVDSILPLVSELTAYQALVYVALYNLDIPDAESAIKLVVKHQKLIEDHERRRFEAAATARAIMEQEASGQIAGAPSSQESEARAREIIKRISDAAIELAFVRHSLTSDEVDVDDDADVKARVEANEQFYEEVKADTLNCLTGDDTGCLDEEELDETNCELLWLQKVLGDAIPRSIFESHTKAVGEFLSEMAEIHSLDALDPARTKVKEVTEALLKVSREIRERWMKFSEDTARMDWLESFIETGVAEAAFEVDGGIHLTLSTVGDRNAKIYRERNSLREAIDEAMKEGS